MKKIIFISFISLLILSCETDFEVVGDWEDHTIVYGLLNQSDSEQYIRLQRSFLGEMSADSMAQIPDSLYYDEAVVTIYELEVKSINNVDTIREIELVETDEIEKKEIGFDGQPGYFTTEGHLLYKTNESFSYKEDYEYLLEVFVPEYNKYVYGKTGLIDDIRISKPNLQQAQKISFASINPYEVEFRTAEGAKIYGLTLRFHYVEGKIDGSSEMVHDSVDWKLPYKVSTKTTGNVEMYMNIAGDNFYSFLGTAIKEDSTLKRQPGKRENYNGRNCLDFIFSVGSEDLYTYIEVNGTSDGLVQDKPSFTNIENGYGVFAAMNIQIIEEKDLSLRSYDSLGRGRFTKHLNFVDSNGELPWE